MDEQQAVVGLIAVVVPALLGLVKIYVWPKIPKLAVPAAAIILGALAQIASVYAGLPDIGVVWGALLGAAGIGLRELLDQTRHTVAYGIEPSKRP